MTKNNKKRYKKYKKELQETVKWEIWRKEDKRSAMQSRKVQQQQRTENERSPGECTRGREWVRRQRALAPMPREQIRAKINTLLLCSFMLFSLFFFCLPYLSRAAALTALLWMQSETSGFTQTRQELPQCISHSLSLAFSTSLLALKLQIDPQNVIFTKQGSSPNTLHTCVHVLKLYIYTYFYK